MKKQQCKCKQRQVLNMYYRNISLYPVIATDFTAQDVLKIPVWSTEAKIKLYNLQLCRTKENINFPAKNESKTN